MKQISREWLKLNKNLLLGLVSSFIISAIVAQSLSGEEDYLISTYTLIVGYAVFFLVFGVMFYIDFKDRYLLCKNLDQSSIGGTSKQSICPPYGRTSPIMKIPSQMIYFLLARA